MQQSTTSALKIFFSVVLLCFTTNIFAQKYAHINFGNLLEGLPQVKEADNIIIAYQDSLKQILQSLDSKLKSDFAANQAKYQQGTLSQHEVNTINDQLGREQQKLMELSQKYEQAIFAKREKELEPVISRVNLIIQEYGKQEGYTAIFDQSRGFILFNEDSMDLTETIRGLLLSQ